jgi:hypothetical protein
MSIKPEDVPTYPATLTFVPMEAPDNPHVFAFMCVFPSGVRFTISSVFPKIGVVDVAMATDFTKRVVATLLEKRDDVSVRHTNWVSATAAIQRLLIEFNNKRGAKEASGLVAPDGRLLQ